jgi:hypothetical protein
VTRGARRAALLVLAGAALGLARAAADVPIHTEQLVYSVTAFNGRDYSGTFVRQPSDVIYLLANVDSFLAPRKTLVYFWPLTGEYRLDTDTLDVPLPGTLMVSGPGTRQSLPLQVFTFFNRRSEYEMDWGVAKDEDARKIHAAYQRSVDQYLQAQAEFELERKRYEGTLDELTAQAAAIRSRGGDASAVERRAAALVEPASPRPPSEYAAPPGEPQNAFVINLPAGNYRIQLRNPDGTIAEGSDKRVVVFSPRSSGTTGYDVVPGDKWTRPEKSETPGTVTYVNGSTDLYLRPYQEAEAEDLYYRRLLNNDGRGNRNLLTWIQMRQIPNAAIQLDVDGRLSTVGEEPFKIEQVAGSTLGYTIKPMDRASDVEVPDLIAYRVPSRPTDRLLRVAAVDATGAPLPGSEREIRVVPATRAEGLLALIVALPLVAAVVVAAVRRRRLSQE